MAKIILKNVSLEIPFIGHSRFFDKNLSKNITESKILGSQKVKKNNKLYSKIIDDVTFDCHDGDKIGILGHNGSGKTTLIRLISGIYEPSKGYLKVDGKMTSLINVGPMLEADFTGYENIRLFWLYFNKSLPLDELVKNVETFSELGDFLHVPIKKYSSGMQTRLIFSLTTFVKPEIQLTDEGLATGDEEFRKKTKDILNEYNDSAKIKIYASHQLRFIKDNCNKVFIMKKGKLKVYHNVENAIKYYTSDLYKTEDF